MPAKGLMIAVLAWVSGLQQEAPPNSEGGGPKLVVVGERAVDLGKIREGRKIDVLFAIENQGDADLILTRVKASCGCTTVKLSEKEKVIPPGKRQDIVVTFDSKGRPGKQSKSVAVYSNDRDTPHVQLKFSVEVETLFRTVPATKYDFRSVRRGEKFARWIDVIPTQPEGELEIVSVEIPGTAIHYEVEPLPGEGSRGKRIRLTADEDAPIGRVTSVATIKVKVSDEEETRSLRITGYVLGDLTVSPTIVRLDKPTVRGSQLRPVTITSTSGDPFDVLGVSAGSNFETKLEPEPDRTKYTVRIRIAADAADGPCGTYLSVWTDSVVQPLVRVPIFAHVAPRIRVEPPIVLLRSGGSAEAATRRVALQNPTGAEFTITGVSADQAFVEANAVDRQARSAGYRYVQISLKDGVGSGEGRAKVTVRTDVAGAEVLEIPVVVVEAKSQTAR